MTSDLTPRDRLHNRPNPAVPAPRPSQQVTQYEPTHTSIPPHAPGHLTFGGNYTRESCRDQLPRAVLERVRRYVGADVRAWFADPFGLEGRPRAGYFSSQAACFADPIERSDGRKSYSISCYQFDDASLRYVPVDQIIDLRAVRQTGTPTDTAPARAQQPDGGPPVSYRLAAILGNLPWKAQQLLQEPFADGRAVLRDGHYYLGDDYKLDPLVLFIAGERHITFASGTLIRRIDGSPDRSRWVGTCYRADVKRRIGA